MEGMEGREGLQFNPATGGLLLSLKAQPEPDTKKRCLINGSLYKLTVCSFAYDMLFCVTICKSTSKSFLNLLIHMTTCTDTIDLGPSSKPQLSAARTCSARLLRSAVLAYLTAQRNVPKRTKTSLNAINLHHPNRPRARAMTSLPFTCWFLHLIRQL